MTEERPYARMFIQAIAAAGGAQQVASRSPGRAEGGGIPGLGHGGTPLYESQPLVDFLLGD